MNRRAILIVAGIALAAGAWALFRPELIFIDKTVNEAAPAVLAMAGPGPIGAPIVVASGQFHNGAHDTSGTAEIQQFANGRRILRLTGFQTSNGPDVRVLLVGAADPMDNDAVTKAKRLELGSLKGNIGDQNYDIPAGADLAEYQSVVIWCHRFGVNFGAAPLMMSATQAAAPMREPMPAGSARTLASGSFHKGAHDTKGTATLYQLPDGTRVLRLAGFETSNGPDVRVLLVSAADPMDNDSVKNATRLELGKLKGNIGDQNYEIPAGADLAAYKSVVIWCNRFSVNFGAAPLSMGG
jgi:hypothetical protein